jgi:hypothetical protein
MSTEASVIIEKFASKSQSTLVRPTEQLFGRKFGRVAKALWPTKTAAHLAAAARVSERCAEYWIAGKREPSALAVQAIVNEMLE